MRREDALQLELMDRLVMLFFPVYRNFEGNLKCKRLATTFPVLIIRRKASFPGLGTLVMKHVWVIGRMQILSGPITKAQSLVNA